MDHHYVDIAKKGGTKTFRIGEPSETQKTTLQGIALSAGLEIQAERIAGKIT